MTGRQIPLAALTCALLALAASARAATYVDRELTLSPDQARIEKQDGHTRLVTPRAAREDRAGRPDLPWLGMTVDVPDGQRVTAVEVTGIETQPIAEHVQIEPAGRALPGEMRMERTAPDPAFFASANPQPEIPVELGTQGYRRGHHEVWLKVAPLRWSPRTGLLERVSSVRLRLTLEADAAPDVAPRERVVADWEDQPGPLVRGSALPMTSMRSLRGRAQPFAATQVPSLLGSPVQYLIITNNAMAAEYQRLADWKTQSGVPAVVRTVEFIRQQYPSGADDAERIRKFIRDAYSRWGVKWVLLGGDTDVIPTRYGYTTFYNGNYIATDLYYMCLDGTWNADGDSIYGEGYFSSDDPGDGCDLLPDVYVGRAATTSALDAQRFVNRDFQYSRTPVGDYETNVLMFGEVLFPQDWTPGAYITLDGAELIEEVLPTFNGHPEFHVARLYENYTGNYTPGALPLNKATVLDSLDRGYGLVVHVGHGYRNTMSVGNETLDNGDASSLTNGNRLMNLYAIDCTSNAIDYPSIGEAFMSAGNGGAVSNIGSTNFDFPTAGRVYQDEYFNLVVHDSVTAIGEAASLQKLPFVGFSVYDGVNRWTQFTLLLLGDPEMRIWTNTPRTLAVTQPASMLLSDSTIAVNVKIGATNLANARVTAYRAGTDFASALTNAAGDVTLPFHPDSLGPVTLTVTGFNCRPYQSTVNVTPTSLPTVVDPPSFIVDDDNVGGTTGNSDGVVDAGEVVELKVPLRNNGGSTAPSVWGTLSTTDPWVTISVPSIFYGSMSPGAQVTPTSGFRISTPYNTADQRELQFTMRVFDGTGSSRLEKLQVVLHGPDLDHASHSIVDTGGNSDGIPDPGETVSYTIKLRNNGTGSAGNVTLKLRNHDGLAAVTDSTASFGTIAPGAEATGDAVVFVPSSADANLEVLIYDQYGLIKTQTIDLQRPFPPDELAGSGQSTNIRLQWHRSISTDVRGYNIYRSTSFFGPFAKVNSVPTDRTAYYMDEGLTPLTQFYFQVTAVDSSANESEPSFYANASTNPPTHTIFPIPLGGTTPSSVAIDHVYSGYPVAIFAGANVLYGWHPDGTSPVDADGAGTTAGDFSTLGKYFAAGPSIADLDGDGSAEIIAPTWTDTSLYVFDKNGALRPGWPLHIHDPIWSSVAVGDLNKDGSQELVFGSNGNNLYAMRADGSEWMDGDNNPATKGVFKVLGAPYNYGTPALADINNDGYLDIVYGGFDGNLYVWDRFGNNLPGFPVYLGANITASVAVGALDGPGDTSLEIVVGTSGDYLYVVNNNGTVRSGFPLWMKLGGSSKTPSPALADMNGDGYLDIVQPSTNGGIYVISRNGGPIIPWNNQRYSDYTNGASESSPVVADINGDGLPDIIMGAEDNRISAFSNNGTMLPGFPIILEGEVRGTPAVCDCDGDGMTEIVVAGWDKLLHMWDYDFPFSPGKVPQWPQFHHDARRTGLVTSPAFVGVNEPEAAAPKSVEFALPAPNPARTQTRLDYAIPSDHAGQAVDLALFDLTGRRVRTLAHGIAAAGRRSVIWDLRGEDGSPARTGVYFARFQLGSEVRSHKLLIVH